MDETPDMPDDLSPLETRRARLRAFQDRLMDHVETLPMPASYIEAERAQRYIGVTDRVLVQLYSRPAKPEMRPAFAITTRDPIVRETRDPSPRRDVRAPAPESEDLFDDELDEIPAYAPISEAEQTRRKAFDTHINQGASIIAQMPDLFPNASPEHMTLMRDIRREALDLMTPSHGPPPD